MGVNAILLCIPEYLYLTCDVIVCYMVTVVYPCFRWYSINFLTAVYNIFTDDFSDKMKDALVVSNEFAIALSKNHRSMQKIIAENSGSSLLVMMEALMKLSGLRATLSEIKLPSSKWL